MAQHVTDQDFDEVVLKSKIPVMIDFYADWCGPCKALAPVVDELSGEYEGKVKIVKMDVDANPDAPQKYGILSIPTMVFIKDGDEVDRLTGALPKDTFVAKLDSLV